MSENATADRPKQRPLWLRVLVQIGLAVVLSLVTPLLGVPLSPLLGPLMITAKHAGATKEQMFGLIIANGALPYLLTGALAALLTWWLVRKAWDVLGFCGIYGAFIVAMGFMMAPREPQTQAWFWPTMVAGEIVALFLGAALVALLLQRRKPSSQAGRYDAAEFLP